MKFIFLLLTTLGLAAAIPGKCRSRLPPLEVCAYYGCFLNIGQSDMEALNCDRKLRGKPPLQFYSEGKCPTTVIPKCKEFDF